MSTVQRMSQLFQSYHKAHGQYQITAQKANGKIDGQARTVLGPLTVDLWQGHLSGEGAGLGGIPLLDDLTVKWAALDIDDRGIDHVSLCKRIAEKGLPLVVCSSKSQGAHCYIFFKEPVPAELVRDRLMSWAAELGYAGCEVFPKQVSRIDDTDVGNWINLPYFNSGNSLRTGYTEHGKIDLYAFLDLAESKLQPRSFIETDIVETIPLGSDEFEFYQGPPCLAALFLKGPLQEGGRNNMMVAVGVYLKKRFPDTWDNLIAGYNAKMCEPVLPNDELQGIIKSLKRKDYDYPCKQPPIAQFCDRKKCLGCKFGVGNTGTDSRRVEIISVTVYQGDPVYWRLELENGIRVQMTTEEFIGQTKHNAKILEATRRYPGKMPEGRWAQYIDGLSAAAFVIHPPSDASPQGQFILYIKQFVNSKNRAQNIDEIVRDVAYVDDQQVAWFKSIGLYKYLKAQGLRYQEHEIWNLIRDWCSGKAEQRKVAGRNERVWCIDMKQLDGGPPESQEPPDFERQAPF